MKSISALMRDYEISPEQKPPNDDWNVGKLKLKNHWGKGSYGGTAGPIEEESGEPASIPDVTSLSKKSCERADVRFPLPLLLLSSNAPSQLTQSTVEIYDEPEPDPTSNDDQAADDRIAEQFRREFLDAISSRRQRSSQAAKAARAAKNRGTKVDDRPKGPKLGGSRSARAAMRELQAKEAKERKR